VRGRGHQTQFAGLRSDDFQYTVELFDNIGIPETDDPHASLFKPFLAFTIMRFVLRVLTAVEFDREIQCGTIEVENIAAGRVLATKARVTYLTVPQSIPESPFHVGLIAPQSSRKDCLSGRPIEVGHAVTPTRRAFARVASQGGRPPPFRGR